MKKFYLYKDEPYELVEGYNGDLLLDSEQGCMAAPSILKDLKEITEEEYERLMSQKVE